MILVVNNSERISCSKAVKGNDYIKLYDENNLKFRTLFGIHDFSKFTIEGGEFTEAPLDDITQLQIAIAELAEVVANG